MEGCIRGNNDHTIKISGVTSAEENGARVVSTTTEKMGYAGTYKFTFFLPGGGPLSPDSTYKPK